MEQNYQTTTETPKYTSGPWRVEENHETLWIWDSPKNKIVAIKHINGEDSNEVESDRANARLIAAAPELLDTLKGFVNALSHLEKNNIPERLWDKAQSVIEKATGKKETAI